MPKSMRSSFRGVDMELVIERSQVSGWETYHQIGMNVARV
jgi:hypothetical protein